MKKILRLALCLVLSLIICSGTVIALAYDMISNVKTGETHKGDLFSAGETLVNNGNVQGDIFMMVQTMTTTGDVDGDIIGGAFYNLNVDGNINGNLRVVSNDATVSAIVERNVMMYGSKVLITKDAMFKRNAYIGGGVVDCAGTIIGDTNIDSPNVTLQGRYEGDVIINDMTEDASLKILPGTVIKGKFTYKGVNQYKIPENVQVGDFEYIKINPVSKKQTTPRFSVWTQIKGLITLVLYYLIALLLYKLFPRFFKRSGDFISAKPMSAAGIGIATLGSLVGGGLLLIILLFLAVFIFKASVFFFGGLIFVFVASLTILFADIPVSLWLGGVLSKYKLGVPARLAIGLFTITIVKFVLDMLGNIHSISTMVGIISFLLNATIWVLGTGALLRVIFDIFKSANIQAENEEFEIEPINFEVN